MSNLQPDLDKYDCKMISEDVSTLSRIPMVSGILFSALFRSIAGAMVLVLSLISGVSAASDRGATLPKVFAVEDIRVALERAEAIHPHLFWHADRRLVLAREKFLLAAMPDPTTSMDVYLILSELVGLLGDGHVSVARPPAPKGDLLSAYSKGGGSLLMVAVEPVSGGLRVIQSRATGISRGDILRTINGYDANELFERAMDLAEGEPALKSLITQYNFYKRLWDLNIQAPFAVSGTFSAQVGDVEVSDPTGPLADEDPGEKSLDLGISARTTSDGIFVIDFYNMTANREKFQAGLLRIFEEIKKAKPLGVVIDLRRNGGGNSGLGDDLLSYVNGKPYRPFARKVFLASHECKLHFAAHYRNDDLIGIVKGLRDGETHTWEIPITAPAPNTLRFGGPVAVLIGPGTFSSANIMANSIGDFQLAKLIGRDTAEIPNNYGMACPITLPNAGIELSVPSTYFVRANGDEASGEDVHPDIDVPPQADGHMGGDPDFMAARQWLFEQIDAKPSNGQERGTSR